VAHDGGVSDHGIGEPSTEQAEAAVPQPSPSRKRASQTVADMVRSLGLVLVVVVVILLITLRHNPPAVTVINPFPVYASVAANSPYPPMLPRTPEGWRPTAAHNSPTGAQPYTWLVGFLTPSSTYAELAQSDGLVGDLVTAENAQGDPAGSVTIDGTSWQMIANDSNGRRALIATLHDANTVVSGTASFADLETLAGGLKPAPRPTQSAAVAHPPSLVPAGPSPGS
jgi:Protein of unknown function (DUF4245)